jgi:hypothetical protein
MHKCEHVLKQSYHCLKELYGLGKNNWCTYVHGIAQETGFESVWISQELDSKTLGLMKEKLFKNFKEKCMNNIQDSECYPKLRTYKKFKINFREEFNFSVIKDYRYVIALIRFRISSHNLRIETGRYTRPKVKVDQRVCIYCNSNETEDELHFLIRCSLFSKERDLLYKVCSEYIHDIEDRR